MLLDILDQPAPAGRYAGQTLIADKNCFGREFEATLATTGISVLLLATQALRHRSHLAQRQDRHSDPVSYEKLISRDTAVGRALTGTLTNFVNVPQSHLPQGDNTE